MPIKQASPMLGFSFSFLRRGGSSPGGDGRAWMDCEAWNGLGRAPLETEVTTGWTDGKPWEIAWGDAGGSLEHLRFSRLGV